MGNHKGASFHKFPYVLEQKITPDFMIALNHPNLIVSLEVLLSIPFCKTIKQYLHIYILCQNVQSLPASASGVIEFSNLAWFSRVFVFQPL